MKGWSRHAVATLVALLVLALLSAGSALAMTPVDLAHDWNTRVDGGANSENLGGSVANAGDVNGDGVDDLLIGAINASVVYVVYGQPHARRNVLDAGTLTGAQGYLIKGPPQSETGYAVADAGDVDGDGVPDALIGSSSNTAWVVFGQRTPNPATITLADIGTPGNTQGYAITRGPDDDFVGSGTAGLGDVNGDGIPDALIGGMSSNHNGRSLSGSAWVVFGQRGSVAAVDLGALSAAQGYRIDGASAQDALGSAVAAAGDVNRGRDPDTLLAAGDRTFQGRSDSGSAYVLYGRRSVATPIDLALLTQAQGYEIGGSDEFQGAGNAVASAGDVDGDGTPDALVGASSTGQAYVVFGQRTSPTAIDLADVGTIGNRQGTRYDPPFPQSALGTSVAAGGVNADGIPDAILGDGGAGLPPGEGFVVWPAARARAHRDRRDRRRPGQPGRLRAAQHRRRSAPANDLAMANAGDLDGDGGADVAMTAPFNSRSAGPTTEGAAWTTLTALVLPLATTGTATDVAPGAATLTGTVGTDAATCASAGTPTTSHFELGPTAAYGTETAPATAGTQVGDVPASAPLTGLVAGTYHYRLVAECADGGRFFGADRTVTVPAAPPPPTPGGGGSGGSSAASNGASSSSGSGGTAGATSAAPVTSSSGGGTAVVRSVTGIARVARVRHGIALVKLRCSAPAGSRCRGVLTLSAGRRLGRASYAIHAERRRTIRIHLTAAGVARVAHNAGDLRVTATTTTRQAGTTGRVKRTRTVVLRATA